MTSISYLPSSIFQFSDRINLGMREAGGAVVSLGEKSPVLHNNGADGGIGGCQSKPPGSFLDRQTHEVFVRLAPLLGFVA